MIGLHTVRLWQNETFHCRNHMNIITKTRKWERRRQIVTSTVFRGAYYLALEMIVCVNFSLVVAVLCSWRQQFLSILNLQLDRSYEVSNPMPPFSPSITAQFPMVTLWTAMTNKLSKLEEGVHVLYRTEILAAKLEGTNKQRRQRSESDTTNSLWSRSDCPFGRSCSRTGIANDWLYKSQQHHSRGGSVGLS